MYFGVVGIVIYIGLEIGDCIGMIESGEVFWVIF